MLNTLANLNINLLEFVITTLFVFLLFIFLIGARRGTINCLDLITNRDGKLDINAIGQVCGVVIAVWAPAYTTYLGKLDPLIYGLSLTYLAGIKGFATYMRYKHDVAVNKGDMSNESRTPPTQN